MSQCLHITLDLPESKKFTQILHKKAKTLQLEGTVQISGPKKAIIMICGVKDAINDFVDFLHQELAKKTIENIQIEPFIKGRDYRGVFRIIE